MERTKSDHITIGKEGFAMMDEFFHNLKYQQPRQRVCEDVNAQAKKNVNSYKAAQLYGGTLIAEYCKNKEPLMRLPKSNNYKAAQLYGGTLIAEYCKNKEPLNRLPKS